jgi:hypothetical protein
MDYLLIGCPTELEVLNAKARQSLEGVVQRRCLIAIITHFADIGESTITRLSPSSHIYLFSPSGNRGITQTMP